MNGFSQNFIDTLKQKITLSDFVKSAVSWDKKKSVPARQDWWSPCPFHYEKSASFHVDDRKGFYHCFGCGVHGTIIDWLINHQRMNFVEALTHLCHVTNTPVPEYSRQNAEKTEQKKTLYDLMQNAQNYYTQLLYHPRNQNALGYVTQKRQISKNNIEKYGIGYADNNRTGLFDFLIAKGYSTEQCFESGMIIIPDDGTKPYDRFRDRIMFPVRNIQGKIITYGGRALGADAKAKYLNGSETEIFKKSLVLYNLDKATQKQSQIPAPKELPKGLIVCEGYMDVITLGCYGFNNVVAPMGTALTLEQIKLLWRYSPEPILCFDGDKAGLAAACRAAHKVLEILEAGYSLNFCFLPDNLDPDDYLKKHGKEAFKTLLDNAVPLSAVLFAQTVEAIPPTSPEKRAGLEKELFAISHKIPDARLKALYQSDFFTRLNQLVAKKTKPNPFLKNTYKSDYRPDYRNGYKPNYSESQAVNQFKKHNKKNDTDSLGHIENMILGFFVRFGNSLQKADFDILSKISFESKEKKQLQSEILNVFLKNHIKKLEIYENMPNMPSDKIDLKTENLWQLSNTICQSDLYRHALMATESIKMTLNLPFINHDDRINYLSGILRYGLCDMYHQLLSEREVDNFLNEMSSVDSLEEKALERFVYMKKQTSSNT